jgi:hypothetical protein
MCSSIQGIPRPSRNRRFPNNPLLKLSRMSQPLGTSHFLTQNTNHEALAVKIHEQLSAKGYEGLSSFLTSIQLPFAPLAIRNRAIRLYLENALVPVVPVALEDVAAPIDPVVNAETVQAIETPSDEPIVDSGLPETITVREALKLILSASLTTDKLQPTRKSPLHIQITLTHPTLSDAWVWLTSIPKAEFVVRMKRKRDGDMVPEGLSIARVDKALMKLGLDDFKFPLNEVVGACVVESIDFNHEPVWIAGRYNKLKRHISVFLGLFMSRIRRGLLMGSG